jgi:FtsP/CotA-like multicopper oxidase with cupredoxin domain
MSTTRKALLAVGAVAVLAVAFALLQPSDDAETPTRAQEPAATTDAPSTVEDAPVADQDEATGVTATAPAAPPRPAATQIRVRGGEPVGGVKTIEVERGDTIRFSVSSDQSDEVHVHGYDLERPVGPDAPARFSFTADADGIFEVELHGSGAQIASLEVQPG